MIQIPALVSPNRLG